MERPDQPAGSGSQCRTSNGRRDSPRCFRKPTDNRLEQRIGGGFLNVVFISSLDAINDIVRERDQTVTHFGFEPDEIQRVAANSTSLSASRWTPAGTALDFDHIWDGYDLLVELTRLVRVT